MFLDKSSYQKLKKKYLKYIKSQEAKSEPFRDKIVQLNNFYLPISQMIKETYSKEKKTKIIGLILASKKRERLQYLFLLS